MTARHALIYPMFALVLLTGAVLVRMFRARVRAVREGQVSAAYFRLYRGEIEPESTAKLSRHFANLFETPVLFYVACLAAMIVHADGIPMQVLAWLYVATRLAHAAAHLGGNRLRKRIPAFFASLVLLFAMWIWLLVAGA